MKNSTTSVTHDTATSRARALGAFLGDGRDPAALAGSLGRTDGRSTEVLTGPLAAGEAVITDIKTNRPATATP